MDQHRLANILSFILGPQVWLLIIILAFIFKTGLTYQQKIILLPSLLILQLLVPIICVFMIVKIKKIKSWDLLNRTDRYPLLFTSIISYFFSLILIYAFGNKLLLDLNIALFLTVTAITLNTLFWKISIHAGVATLGVLLINFLFAWSLPILFLLIPIVIWSRLVLKRHTIWQLLGGAILSTVIIIGSLKALGYL